MVSVEDAISIIKKNLEIADLTSIMVPDSLNYFLGEDVYAPINVPSFNQSAMDGYAFKFEDVGNELDVVEEIPAGDIRTVEIKNGQAVRIFTGAMVPDSCDTVVMQELTEVNGNKLIVKDSGLKKGGNIRKEGHQITKGDLALEKGSKITPAAIGFLSSLGLTEVKVYKLPMVTVLATGDELVKPGNELQKGQVYESNTLMLKAALKEFGINPLIVKLPDNFEKTKMAVKTAIDDSDIILLSGGISVGDYDYVKPSLDENGVEQLFYKVKQKPGKPLFFGKKEKTLIFALPGNPGASLNCFYVYVSIALNGFIGNPNLELKKKKALIQKSYKKKSGRAEFLKAFFNEGEVEILEGQGSDVLLSFSKANCIVYISNELEYVEAGEEIEIFMLPV